MVFQVPGIPRNTLEIPGKTRKNPEIHHSMVCLSYLSLSIYLSLYLSLLLFFSFFFLDHTMLYSSFFRVFPGISRVFRGIPGTWKTNRNLFWGGGGGVWEDWGEVYSNLFHVFPCISMFFRVFPGFSRYFQGIPGFSRYLENQ